MAVAGARFELNAAARSEQIAELKRLDILCDVAESDLLLLLDRLTFRACTPGTTFSIDRGPDAYCYFVLHGTLWTTLHAKDEQEALLGALGRGDCFGGGPLFGLRDQAATAYAETNCYLLQIRLEVLQALLSRTPTLAAALHRYYRRQLAHATLVRAPIFSQLSPAVRESIIERFEPVQVDRNTEILREGDKGDSFYIIELGQVAVEQNGAVIAHLGEGDFFGEISLLEAQPHTATVRSLTPTDLLKLPARDFADLLTEQPELRRQVQRVSDERLEEQVSIRSDGRRVAELELIVQHGLMRGTHLLVRRPNLCPPGCHICEEACSSRFGQPRLRLDGVTVGNYEVPVSCRQCQFGAECVEVCPEEAIVWDEAGVLVINDRCTGCGQCVPACPYDAIDLVEHISAKATEQNGQLMIRLWERFRPRRADKGPTLTASKCDLCHGYEDKACLTQCPTGSLQLVPVESLFAR